MALKGIKQTPEHVMKRTKGLKTKFLPGNIPWNKGKKGLQVAHNKGKKASSETIRRLSLSHIGKSPWNKGLKLGPSWNKGLTQETDERIKRYTDIRRGIKYPKDKFPNHGFRAYREKQILPLKDTSIEIKIQNFLKELGISFFTHQYIKEIEHGYQCDILVPSMNLVIECDGDYWHKYPVGRDIDKIRTEELIKNGFKVLRLWERDIRRIRIKEFKQKLAEIK